MGLSAEWREAFVAMALDWEAVGPHRYALALEDFAAYQQALVRGQLGERPDGEAVPQWSFCLEDGGRIVACLRMRTRLTAALLDEGGHIGYDVSPSMRRRGYGTQLLALGIIEARRRNITRIRITCDADNQASIKIIERNGGLFSDAGISTESGARINRYWIE
ncbi:MAG: GNAT family N-acetyltransferase [Polyangiales bacterium]